MKTPFREWLGALLARMLAVWTVAILAMLMLTRKPGEKHEVPPTTPALPAAPDAGTAR